MDAFAARRARPGAGERPAVNSIELEQVTLARAGRAILSDATFGIAPGEFVGVFGPNGAGKTTLLHAILGLLRPAAGTLRVFGSPPSRGNPRAGYLPQQRGPIADLRVRGWDFVASALHAGALGTAAAGSRRARRDRRRRSSWWMPRSWHGGRSCELSGGELQRLLLAQALLGKPDLLLLDEPLISLDLHFQGAVVELVKRIASTTWASLCCSPRTTSTCCSPPWTACSTWGTARRHSERSTR